MLEKNKQEDFLGPRVRLFLKQMFAKKIKFELSLKSKLKQQNKQIIEYDKHQLEILEIVEKQDRLIFEGRAGTGKSKLAEEISKDLLKNIKKYCLFVEPTNPLEFN